MIDLGKLRLFYIVAQEGSVSKAALRLNTSQPALSEHIMNFEHRLGVKLFKRVPTGMLLTPEGEQLFEHAKKIIMENETFERIFYERGQEISGEIKIVTTPFVGAEWLVPNLDGFLAQYSDIRVKIVLKTDAITENEGDIAICLFRPHQPHLIHQYLFTTYIRLFASPEYIQKFGKPERLEDLDHHRLITYRGHYYSAYGSTNWILNVGRKEFSPPRESYLEIDSLHGMLNSARRGFGIVELPDYSNILNSGLVDIFPDCAGPETPMYCIFPERRKGSKKINTLVQYLCEKKK